jgi:hypothetical protein
MTTPKTFTMRFFEAEHSGDLSRYTEDLFRCGATVLDSKLDQDAEEAEVHIHVKDFQAFRRAWQKTDSADFGTSLGWIKDHDDA